MRNPKAVPSQEVLFSVHENDSKYDLSSQKETIPILSYQIINLSLEHNSF